MNMLTVSEIRALSCVLVITEVVRDSTGVTDLRADKDIKLNYGGRVLYRDTLYFPKLKKFFEQTDSKTTPVRTRTFYNS